MLLSKDMVFELSFEEALRLVGRTNIRFFVQVGSNDGKKNDPLYPYVLRDGWKGILVEPDPVNFQNLQKTYSQHSGLIFENVGIAPVNGELLFYKIKEVTTGEPVWYDQLGSFDQHTFLKNISYQKDLINRVETLVLPVITFDELLAKHAIEHVDLLHIDAEGFDYRILRSINFERHPVRLLIFEGEWMTQFELKEIIKYLRRFSYSIYRSGSDYIAISH